MSSTNLPELSEEQLNVLIDATDLPREKILEWYKDFKDYVKENGSLNMENFVKFYKAILEKQGDSDEYCRLVFKAFDKDGSGTIDFSEFILALTISARGNLTDRLNWMFDVYDINNDGSIQASELKRLMKAILNVYNLKNQSDEIIEKRIKMIFTEFDIDRDQVISKKEFVKGCLNDEFLFYFLNPTINFDKTKK